MEGQVNRRVESAHYGESTRACKKKKRLAMCVCVCVCAQGADRCPCFLKRNGVGVASSRGGVCLVAERAPWLGRAHCTDIQTDARQDDWLAMQPVKRHAVLLSSAVGLATPVSTART